ncbi:endonuclease domain-containing protein [Caulobacter sp. S45]|uniref:endonuclease domain-containing protein n=1 Tax=Caulobacter sp. S45 TaxID=1641861 RepID=UPI001C207A4A|nr:DUF559 domain-containing protein [Caulobacter sp. S45]
MGEGRGGGVSAHPSDDRNARGAIDRARRLRREMTLPEKLLWSELRKLDLHVRKQTPIGRYVADFAIHAARLIVEVDGARHDLPENQLHDAERDAWFEMQGYRTLRFTNAAVVNDLNGVVAMIATAALTPPSPTLPPSRGKGE